MSYEIQMFVQKRIFPIVIVSEDNSNRLKFENEEDYSSRRKLVKMKTNSILRGIFGQQIEIRQ